MGSSFAVRLWLSSRSCTAQSQTDALVLDARQDRELEQILQMLKTDYSDPYEPKALPKHKALADSLLGMSGPAYAAAFYRYASPTIGRGSP